MSGKNRRRTPGDDSKSAGSTPVHLKASLGTPRKLVIGEAVWRLQLSQWQWPDQFNGPVKAYVTAPHRQRPVVSVMSSLPRIYPVLLGTRICGALPTTHPAWSTSSASGKACGQSRGLPR